ncbi:MAG: UDP-N-acetylmuramoyl-L-alanyl-D-glutamate--2,6-diaminopimelate ligase [Acidobacteria bacterium RIFCSPLOWO2_12_FULL_54_10]|nr:MAG: UDP-N-acetylmuramoyl-L-alanyl-D-glutamate--2,6-diaminopimelate ligase [Acidobacteria bacterium RIFCSPLOWO2_12_FULL_54_10]
MTLQQLCSILPEARLVGDAGRQINSIRYDSRRVVKGDVFFAIPGSKVDGSKFIPEALERGAAAIVSESGPGDLLQVHSVSWVQIPDARLALALAANSFYDYPSKGIKLIGITGTNGKTTVAFLVASILNEAGWKPALFGTVGYWQTYGVGEVQKAVPNTTPESLDLQRMLREAANGGAKGAVMEVSSHSLAMHRVTGCQFHTAVFTNFGRDHLDFHKDLDSYQATKEKLLLQSQFGTVPKFGVLNADDARCVALKAKTESRIITFGVESRADVTPNKWKATAKGLDITAATPSGNIELHSKLVGRHNISNLLAATATALTLDIPLAVIQRGILAVQVPGRMESIQEGQPFSVFVDYAHTDDALRNLIASSRQLTPDGRILLVFGCGGDRDRYKRPLMGIAAGQCDHIFLTSDNPRSEDPIQILNDVMVGLQKVGANYTVEPNRGQAIYLALQAAHPADTVLIAGKGHEIFQILRDGSVPFDDRETARRILHELGFQSSGEPNEKD